MSTFGHYFRVTTAGESHGKSVSCIIDNCPLGLALVEDDIQPQLNRRRPGQSAIATPRNERNRVIIHSSTELSQHNHPRQGRRVPDAEASKRMEARVAEPRDQNDSTGGTVTYAPSGLGEPAFNKLEALIGHAMLSIPAVKGFEIGSGFLGAKINGSRHNDPFIPAPALGGAAHKTGMPRSRLHAKTNNLGGIKGGIFNGMPIFPRCLYPPPGTISQD
ncbi:hypothetical protein MHUMG1_03487 [Metarhizium humberi]|uniref:chorismate synthase n=1 Tax=Metarhizium humberi TaxID=2596975 RepID=A0A9P8MD46_9HYPO|nr:hypothetical protein MHUMG1_03487 [Metarhizium humberi]